MVIRVPPKLPGFQLLRDTFAGKNLREIWRRETDSEKVQHFYRQKCRATAEFLGTWEPGKKILCCPVGVYSIKLQLYGAITGLSTLSIDWGCSRNIDL